MSEGETFELSAAPPRGTTMANGWQRDTAEPDPGTGLETSPHFDELLAILRTEAGLDFGGYKRPPLLRRTLRRMDLAQVPRLADYVALLRRDPEEAIALGNDLTVSVSGFFRDAEAWEALREVIAPRLAERDDGEPVRAWVTACASGEEAYSLAILLVEEADRLGKRFEVKIFATDTAKGFLDRARSGEFAGVIEEQIPADRLERFFDREGPVYRVKKFLREMVVFAPQNLLSDPPFSRLDLCTCRNLLIYLEPEMQRRVLALLHFALREGGTLFLGSAEMPGPDDGSFEPLNKKWRIYRRLGPTRHGAVDFPIRTLIPAREAGERSVAGSRLAFAPNVQAIAPTSRGSAHRGVAGTSSSFTHSRAAGPVIR